MATYRVLRPFDWTGGIKTTGDTIELGSQGQADKMIAKGFITPAYSNKMEKAVPTINNKAYLVHDKGTMFFVKRAGETLGRYTKKKAEEVRDEINGAE
jgi:hypothetical protein